MVHIRPLAAADRPAIDGIARACGAFTPDEVRVCMELVDDALAGSMEYEVVVADDGGPVGFLTFGTDAIGKGVWEVYWIVTRAERRGRGIGSALLGWLHDRLAGTGARMVLIETSGQPGYEHQRRFYEKNGYREVARVKDFYKPEDDLVVFRRDLDPAPARRRA
jgi:GNAT superfamily N-acetyltransferase